MAVGYILFLRFFLFPVCKIGEKRGNDVAREGVTFPVEAGGLLTFLQVFISVVEELEEGGSFGHGEPCCCVVVLVRVVLVC